MSIQPIKDIFHASYRMNVEVEHIQDFFQISYRHAKVVISENYSSPQEVIKQFLKKLMDYIGINQVYSKPDCLFHNDTFPCFSAEKQYIPEYEISMTRFTDKKFGLYFYKYYKFDSANKVWIEVKENTERIHALLSGKFKYPPTNFTYISYDNQEPLLKRNEFIIQIPEEKYSLYIIIRVTDIIKEDHFCSFIVEKLNYQSLANGQKSRKKFIYSINDENEIDHQVVELEEPWWGDKVLSSNDLMQNPYNIEIYYMLEHLPPKYKSDNIWITFYDIFYIRLGLVWMPQSRYYVTTYFYVFPQYIQDELNMILSIAME